MSEKNVIISIPTLLLGGSEFQTLSLVHVLAGDGCRVTVCCYYEHDGNMVSKLQSAGADVLLMRSNRAEGLLTIGKRLIRLFKEHEPDIVHVQYIAPGFVPVIAARLAGVRTVFATVHQPAYAYGWKERSLLRTAARFCTALFCVSTAVEESWFGTSSVADPEKMTAPRKHFTIYNAVDAQEIKRSQSAGHRDDMKRSLGIDGRKVVGVVGRLRAEKGQKVLLSAIDSVLSALPSTVLLVIGDGPDRGLLEREAAALGIGAHIRWLGQRDRLEVYQLYHVMDVLAVPSLFEGFGLVAAEAMAAGIPVVASDVGGLSEVIKHGVTGLLVNPGDSRQLAGSLLSLLKDGGKAKTMGDEGRKRARTLFSPERFGNTILSTYALLADNRAGCLGEDGAR